MDERPGPARNHNGVKWKLRQRLPQCYWCDMPQLLIPELEPEVLQGLRQRAAADGVTPEEEVRRILRKEVLPCEPAMSFTDFLMTMPEIEDEFILRPRHKARGVDLGDR